MKRFVMIFLAVMILTAAVSAPVLAAAGEKTAVGKETIVSAEQEQLAKGKLDYFKIIGVTIIFVIAFAAVGGALMQGMVVSSAVKGISQQKFNINESSKKITLVMVIGLAMLESLIVYVLVVSLILLFGDPFGIAKLMLP